ncbi:MAG: tetratricopeptide repeat protein [Bryobacteraceae bacterium]
MTAAQPASLTKAAAFVLVLASVAHAAGAWTRAASSDFEVLTDDGERTARLVHRRFTEIHRVLRSAAHGRDGAPLPVRVLVFRADREFRRFRPSESTIGFYQSGPERDYIVLRHSGPQTYRIAFHEYVHLVLNHSSAKLPRWMEEGLAEFYSTVELRDLRLRIGRVIPDHVAVLSRERWLDAAELSAVTHESPYFNERGRANIFYAQSWALVHMLNLDPRWREQLPDFAARMAEGVPPVQAFQQSFGRSLADAILELGRYVAQRRFAVAEVDAPPAEEVAGVEVGPVSGIEVDLAQAELLMLLGKSYEAHTIYERLSSMEPDSPEAATGLGMAAMQRRDFDAARRYLEKAIALGSRQPATYFEYAMLLRESGGDRTEVARYLERVTVLQPSHAEAQFLLGVMAAADGRHEEAVERHRRAVEVLPRQSYFWHALAISYRELGQRELARRAAFRALDAAATPEERDRALAAVRLADQPDPQTQRERTAVVVPESWRERKGDAFFEGRLTHLDCTELSVRFRFEADGETLVLAAGRRDRMRVTGFPQGFDTFQCGPQEGRRVRVEYERSTARPGAAGNLVAIEAR